VVWARADGAGSAQNLGALHVDKDLDGTLKTVTPLRTFDVFITAESSPTARAELGASPDHRSSGEPGQSGTARY